MRFLGVELAGNVPDAHTVWTFRESLKEHKLAEVLFKHLSQALAGMGIELKKSQIIDATFVPTPIQHNGRDNKSLIKTETVLRNQDADGEQVWLIAPADQKSKNNA